MPASSSNVASSSSVAPHARKASSFAKSPAVPLTAEQVAVQSVPRDAAMLEVIPRGDVFAQYKLATSNIDGDIPLHLQEKLALFEQSFSVLKYPQKSYTPVVLDSPAFKETFHTDTLVIPTSNANGAGGSGANGGGPPSALMRSQKSLELISSEDAPTKLKVAEVFEGMQADGSVGESGRARGSAAPLPEGYEGKKGPVSDKDGASAGNEASPPAPVVAPVVLRSYFPGYDWTQGAEVALCERTPLPLPLRTCGPATRFLLHAKALQMAIAMPPNGREVEPLFCEIAVYNIAPESRTKLTDTFTVQLSDMKVVKNLESHRVAKATSSYKGSNRVPAQAKVVKSPFLPETYVNATSTSPCTRALFSLPPNIPQRSSSVAVILLVYRVLQGKLDSLDVYSRGSEVREKDLKASESKSVDACRRWGEHKQLAFWNAAPLFNEAGGINQLEFKELYKQPKTDEAFTLNALCDAAHTLLNGKKKNAAGLKVIPGQFLCSVLPMPSSRSAAVAEAERIAPVFNSNLVPVRMENVVETPESVAVGHEVLITTTPPPTNDNATTTTNSSVSDVAEETDTEVAAADSEPTADGESTTVTVDASKADHEATVYANDWVEVAEDGSLVRKSQQANAGVAINLTPPTETGAPNTVPLATSTTRPAIKLDHERHRSYLPPPSAVELGPAGYIQEVDMVDEVVIYTSTAPIAGPTAASPVTPPPATLGRDSSGSLSAHSAAAAALAAARIAREAVEEQSSPFLMNYTNQLYVYPQSVTFSDARNVVVAVQIKDTHLSGNEPGLDLIYPRGDELLNGINFSGNSRSGKVPGTFVNQTFTSATYHCYNASFVDEIKIELPLVLKPSHHLLFTFYNISCKESVVPSKDGHGEDRTLLGFAMLPLYLDNRIVDEGYTLPVFTRLKPHYLLQKDEFDERRSPLFALRLRINSSIYSNDPYLNRFFLSCSIPKSPSSSSSSSASGKNHSEDELLSMMLRRVLRSGQLRKKGGLKWNDRWWSLTDSSFVAFKNHKDTKPWHFQPITPRTLTQRSGSQKTDDELKNSWSIRADGVPSAHEAMDSPTSASATLETSPSPLSAAPLSPVADGDLSPSSASSSASISTLPNGVTSPVPPPRAQPSQLTPKPLSAGAAALSAMSSGAGSGASVQLGLDAEMFENEMSVLADSEDEMFSWLKAIAHARIAKLSIFDAIRGVREAQGELLIKHLPSIMRQLLSVICCPDSLGSEVDTLIGNGATGNLEKLKLTAFETLLEVASLVENGSGATPDKQRNVHLDSWCQYVFDDNSTALPLVDTGAPVRKRARAASTADNQAAASPADAAVAPVSVDVPTVASLVGEIPIDSVSRSSKVEESADPVFHDTEDDDTTNTCPTSPTSTVPNATIIEEEEEEVAKQEATLTAEDTNTATAEEKKEEEKEEAKQEEKEEAKAETTADATQATPATAEPTTVAAAAEAEVPASVPTAESDGVKESDVNVSVNESLNVHDAPASPIQAKKPRAPVQRTRSYEAIASFWIGLMRSGGGSGSVVGGGSISGGLSGPATSARSLPPLREHAARFSWLLLDMITKSLLLSTAGPKERRVSMKTASAFGETISPRSSAADGANFFKPQSIKLLTELVQLLTQEIFYLSNISLSLSKTLNKNLALFLRDAFYIFPRAVVSDWISVYLMTAFKLEPSPVGTSQGGVRSLSGSAGASSSRFKYTALQIICDHEHYVAYNARVTPFVGQAKTYLQSSSFGEWNMGDYLNRPPSESPRESPKQTPRQSPKQGPVDAAVTVPPIAAASATPTLHERVESLKQTPTLGPVTPNLHDRMASLSMSSVLLDEAGCRLGELDQLSPLRAEAAKQRETCPPAGHFLPFVLIKQVWLAFRQNAPPTAAANTGASQSATSATVAALSASAMSIAQEQALVQAAYTLRSVLLKHELDSRYQGAKKRSLVASMYIRILPCLWNNLEKLRDMKLTPPGLKIDPNNQAQSQNAPSNNARKDLVACALYVLNNLSPEELLQHFRESDYRIHPLNTDSWFFKFIDLLSIILETVEYGGPLMRRFEVLTNAGGVVSQLSTTLCAKMLQPLAPGETISDWGQAEEISGTGRLGPGGLAALENKYTRNRTNTQLQGHRKSFATSSGGTMKRRDVQLNSNMQAADRARVRLQNRTLNSKTGALLDGGDAQFHAITGIDPAIQRWEKLYAHESAGIVLHILTGVVLPMAQDRMVVSTSMQDRLLWFLHGFLRLNQSDQMLVQWFGLLSTLLHAHASLVWPLNVKHLDGARCSAWWFELLRHLSFHSSETRSAASNFIYQVFLSVAHASGSTTRVQTPLLKAFARVMDALRLRKAEDGRGTYTDPTLQGWTILQAEPKSSDATNDAAFIGVLSALSKSAIGLAVRAANDPERDNFGAVACIQDIQRAFEGLQKIIDTSAVIHSIKANNLDPDSLIEHTRTMIGMYRNAPRVRLLYWKHLYDLHMAQSNLAEAGATQFRMFRVIYKQSTKIASQGRVHMSASLWNSDHAMSCLRKASELFEAAELYEQALHCENHSIAHYVARKNPAKVVPHAKRLVALWEKLAGLATLGDTRSFGTFYRVGLYGTPFASMGMDGKEFVYREPNLTKLPEITSRLVSMWTNILGREVTVFKDSGVITSDHRAALGDAAKLQVTAVLPFFEEEVSERAPPPPHTSLTHPPTVPELTEQHLTSRESHFEKNTAIRKFFYDTPYTVGGKSHGTVETQCKKRSLISLHADESFPSFLRRLPVASRVEVDMSPLECVLEDVRKRVHKLVSEARPALGNPDLKTLTQVLSGSVNVQVNGGPAEICQVFLSPSNREKWDPSQLSELRIALGTFVQASGEALKVAVQLANETTENKAFIEILQEGYHALVTSVRKAAPDITLA